LITLIKNNGSSVQLQFDENFESGVELIVNGTSVFLKADYQHNRNYRNLSAQAAESAAAVIAFLGTK
jgi:hypothetical protein